jgi:hypothetical protein
MVLTPYCCSSWRLLDKVANTVSRSMKELLVLSTPFTFITCLLHDQISIFRIVYLKIGGPSSVFYVLYFRGQNQPHRFPALPGDFFRLPWSGSVMAIRCTGGLCNSVFNRKNGMGAPYILKISTPDSTSPSSERDIIVIIVIVIIKIV